MTGRNLASTAIVEDCDRKVILKRLSEVELHILLRRACHESAAEHIDPYPVRPGGLLEDIPSASFWSAQDAFRDNGL